LSPPDRRFWIATSVLTALLLGAWASAWPPVSGRTRAHEARLRSALASIETTRKGPAPTWAPESLAEAETAMRDALVEWHRQESRFVLLRDFGPAERALWRAERAAWDTQRTASERHAEARLQAEEDLAETRALHAHGSTLAAATSLPAAQRVHLQRARLLLAEAESLLRVDELASCVERAESSRAELRRALGPSLEAAERYTSGEEVQRWRRWVSQTRAWSRSTGRAAILVFKEKNLLTLLLAGEPVRSYRADIGANALGDKLRLGDKATPEGHYRVLARKDHGQSRYYRALLLDYPNEEDRRRLATALCTGRVAPGTRLGNLIEIHGEGGLGRNWTDGCVALSNADMDDLYKQAPVGTRVTIVGGDGRGGTFTDLLARIQGTSARP
jgi:hypothetical protein